MRGTAMVAGAAVTWAMIHNIRLRDADLRRIRKELKKDPEEMTVEELKDAMKELGIKELKLD
jgi:signal recognition particle subunit SEC65